MNIQNALAVVSIAVPVAGIAIAIWQIKVKHYRLADVASLLVCAFFIAAAAQIARVLI